MPKPATRSIEYYVAASVDGFIAREDGSFEDFAPDETQLGLFVERIENHYEAVLMGRVTFEVGLAHGVDDPYPWLDTHVFSSTLESTAAPRATVHRGSAVDAVSRLRASVGGRIWLCGGGRLAGALTEAGLVDRLVIKRYPVVFGRGIALFDRPLRRRLRQARCTPYDSGVNVVEYDVDP